MFPRIPAGIAEVRKVLLLDEVLACRSVIWHVPIGALKSRRGGVGGGEPNPGKLVGKAMKRPSLGHTVNRQIAWPGMN